MSTLNIAAGISTIGNAGNTNIDLGTIDSNVNSVKTLVGGQWKSWSRGAPVEFQGFTNLKKGFGYVVNSDAPATVEVSDILVDINDVDINTGLNFICFPFDNKKILNGLLPRVDANSIKTIIGSWKSYSKGATDDFQGFLSVNKDQGYVVSVGTEYDAYLSDVKRDISNGARIGTAYMNDLGSVSSGDMVEFDADSIYQSIDYTPVAYDNTQPLLSLWINLGGTIKEIRFPQELLGKSFNIKENLLDIVSYGLIVEAHTEVEDAGLIIDTPTVEGVDYGDLTGGTLQTNTLYTGTFSQPAGNSQSTPLVIDTVLSVTSMELIYNVLPLSDNPNYNKMLITVGGENTVIEFADEYAGAPFKLIKDDILYDSTFTVSEANYITL